MSKPLGDGARIAVVSPAGPIEADRITAGRARLFDEGWTVDVVGPLASDDGLEHLATSDHERTRSLKEALHTYDAVIFSRGGYGTARLLDDASSHWLATSRTWVIGYSDATALLWAQRAIDPTHLGGIHGPTISTLGTHDANRSADRLIALLRGEPVDSLPVSHLCGPPSPATGPVIAGNLTVATSLIGTRWFPRLDGHIVIFEDVNEAPYRVDRMLTQWRHSGALSGVAGVVLGRFSVGDDIDTTDDMRAVFLDRLGDLGIAVYETSTVGHEGSNAALPIGALVTVDRSGLHLVPETNR